MCFQPVMPNSVMPDSVMLNSYLMLYHIPLYHFPLYLIPDCPLECYNRFLFSVIPDSIISDSVIPDSCFDIPDSVMPNSGIPDSSFARYNRFRYTRFPAPDGLPPVRRHFGEVVTVTHFKCHFCLCCLCAKICMFFGRSPIADPARAFFAHYCAWSALPCAASRRPNLGRKSAILVFAFALQNRAAWSPFSARPPPASTLLGGARTSIRLLSPLAVAPFSRAAAAAPFELNYFITALI